MWKNYLLVAFRNLSRNRLYSVINIAGLAVGLAVCLLVTAYVAHELSFENCHSKKDRICRVQLNLEEEGFGTMELAGAARPLGSALKDACPDVEAIARFSRWNGIKVTAGNSMRKGQVVLAVEPEFFSVFDVKSVSGNPKADLAAPYTVYLTERLATSLFGAADPIGKPVTIYGKTPFQVAGILKDFPTNTKLHCDAMVSFSSLEAMGQDPSDWMAVWTDYLYVLMRPGAKAATLEAALPAVLKSHIKPEDQPKEQYVVRSLRDIYFNPSPSNEIKPSGDANRLVLFCVVALVTLAVACINFVNHTTARVANRVKELSVRMIVGASRLELMRQLLAEFLLSAALASAGAAVIFEVLRPALVAYVGRDLDIGLLNQPLMIIAVIGLPVLVVLTAGIYPAFYLSRTRTLQFLKGGSGTGLKKSFTRRALVVFQFTTAVVLTAVAVVILRQIQFSRNWDKGFDDRNVLILEAEDDQSAKLAVQVRRELLNDPGVFGATACATLPGTQNCALNTFQPPNQPDAKPVWVRILPVDPDFASVLHLALADGRYLSAEDASSAGGNVVIDERAVKALGLNQAVGTRLVKEGKEYNVVGVLKSFHSVPTFTDDWPIMMNVADGPPYFTLIKLKPGDATATISRIRQVWERLIPNQSFEYSFYDETLAQLYSAHEKFGTLLVFFSVIALAIAGLGVFSLASYAAERRRREIGIRKVVGASITSVLRLLGSEFVALVLVAGVIGCPIAWYLSSRWLERFVYRIDLGIGLFLFAGAVSMIVAVLSVCFQALKAASANPVDSLKYE